MNNNFYVYILTNQNNNVLYTGVTNNLKVRIQLHKAGLGSEFTKRYKVAKLAYYEIHSSAYDAISREKQLKSGSRQKKVALINDMNGTWHDLFNEL